MELRTHTMSNLGTPQFHDLPHDIQISIFERLSTEDRAQAAAVCRTWCNISNANWTDVHLWGEGTEAVQARLAWLQTISKHSSDKLRNVRLLTYERISGDPIMLRLSKYSDTTQSSVWTVSDLR